MTVAAQIKEFAHEKGITQNELAAKARMSRASLSLKLNGHRAFTLPEVERLAAALGTTPKALIVRAEQRGSVEEQTPSHAGYEIQDAASGSIILQARRVDWDGGDAA